MGLAQNPPNIVLVGIALLLTLFTMSPVITQIQTTAYEPYVDGQITQEEFVSRAEDPLKEFMLDQTEESSLDLFCDLAQVETPQGGRITVISFEQTNPFTVYRKYALAGLQQIKIGRGSGNDICYQNDFVSHEHCTITLQGGSAILHDTSSNGTFLNFQRVSGST